MIRRRAGDPAPAALDVAPRRPLLLTLPFRPQGKSTRAVRRGLPVLSLASVHCTKGTVKIVGGFPPDTHTVSLDEIAGKIVGGFPQLNSIVNGGKMCRWGFFRNEHPFFLSPCGEKNEASYKSNATPSQIKVGRLPQAVLHYQHIATYSYYIITNNNFQYNILHNLLNPRVYSHYIGLISR